MFSLKLRQKNISEEDLLEDLRKVAQLLNINSITKSQYDEHGCFGATTFQRRFGKWNDALELAGLGINCRQNIPYEELFENIAIVWNQLGRQPIGDDMSKFNRVSKFSLGTYEKRFGSWNKALLSFIQYIDNGYFDNEINSTNSPKENHKRTSRKINWRLRAKILIRDNCICRMCGSSPAKNPSINLHVDHIVPWSKGGETTVDNLQTLCHVCNIGKSDLCDI